MFVRIPGKSFVPVVPSVAPVGGHPICRAFATRSRGSGTWTTAMMRFGRMKLRWAWLPEPPPWLMASTGVDRPGRRPLAAARTYLAGAAMNIYYVAAIWLGMALLASVVSIKIAVPAALIE